MRSWSAEWIKDLGNYEKKIFFCKGEFYLRWGYFFKFDFFEKNLKKNFHLNFIQEYEQCWTSESKIFI